MASHARPASHILAEDDTPAAAAVPARVSLLHRLFDAIFESQMRRAQCEIDRKLGPGALQRAFRSEPAPPR
jgi:hypothetical protein